VAVIVNAAVPFAVPAPNPLLNVTVQVSSAPAAAGNPQLTDETPVPGATAVASTPAGNLSFTVADVAEVPVPALPRPNVYVIVPESGTDAVAVFDSVKLVAGVTVVAALPQLAAGRQPAPGAGGLAPLVGSTDA
jgi:hypothetical protein